MNDHIKKIQEAINALGYDSGAPDGIFGGKTRAAVNAWLVASGKPASQPDDDDLPWLAVGRAKLGLHEVHDNKALIEFMTLAGQKPHDPAKVPWCGRFVETCIRRGIPKEPITGVVKENPYWARNWLQFGKKCPVTYGAVAVFDREGGAGHVGFVVGQDASTLHILGGNQSNSITITKISRNRLLVCRWPHTVPMGNTALRSVANGDISQNEA